MQMIRSRGLIICFLAELCCVFYYLFYGQQGALTIWHTYQESLQVQEKVEALRQEIKNLEAYRAEWQQYPYYKEKVAREQLHMARAQDTVFYIPKRSN